MPGSQDRRFAVQSVVTDLFHTLVDPDLHRPAGFVRAYKIAEVLGLSDADEFARWWGEMEAERHVNGAKKVTQYASDYVFERTGRECTSEQLAEVSRIWGHMHDRALLETEDEVVTALTRLRQRGVKLGLLSNIDEREALNWKRSPLSSLFDVACLSCQIGYSKPSREAYSTVLSKLGVDARESIYVGDGSHHELRGAKEAGFGLVLFMKGFISRGDSHSPERMRRRAEEADGTIMSLDELVSLVDRMRG